MWIDIRTLAKALGKTPRTIQIRIRKDSSIQTRMKDKKTTEVYIPSLPAEWQTAVAKSGEIDVNRQALATLAPSAQLVAASNGKVAVAGLGSKMTNTQRKRFLIANKLRERPLATSATQWTAAVARIYGVSVSTARRIGKELETFGTVGKPRQDIRLTKWDGDAIAFLKGYYIQALSESGACPKNFAWLKCQEISSTKGWRIGSRSSAYQILNEVHPLLIDRALGGRRALDNYFYIARDSGTLQPFQVVIGDQHIFDFWVADYETGEIRRPECYLWLDMHTKLVYGIAFADVHYNSDTVKESLRMGLYRFGRCDCTYNDNGTSECSKAATQMIDDLLRYGIQEKDFSDLYKTADGKYVVLDKDEKKAVDIANTEDEWHLKHHRIYANVRNAKAKDIERFFRTLEGRLSALQLPGKCATPGAPAAVDEVERSRFEKQKQDHKLLTIGQFVTAVIGELKAYEETMHATLKMSPMERLKADIENGFDLGSRSMAPLDIELVTADRKRCTVQRGRVLIDGIWYQGALLTSSDGDLNDTGLYRYDGNPIEVRYSRHDRGFCYAIVGGQARKLSAVEKVPMLDGDRMVEAIKGKNEQIRAVNEVFNALTRPIGNILYKPKDEPEVRMAERTEDQEERKPMKKPALPFLPMHPSRQSRYQWCLDMLKAGQTLAEKDKRWLREYRQTDEYHEYSEYWKRYEQELGEDVAL